MDEKRPQPAWKKKEGQQQSSQDHRSWNKGQRRDNRDRDRRGPPPEQRAPVIGPLEVEVYNNDVGQALKVLKNRLAKDGILTELRAHRHAEKPSEKKRRKHREALKRLHKSKGKARRTGDWKHKDKPKTPESHPLPESQSEQSALLQHSLQDQLP